MKIEIIDFMLENAGHIISYNFVDYTMDSTIVDFTMDTGEIIRKIF